MDNITASTSKWILIGNGMQQLINLYDQFLHFFPDQWHPWISVAVVIAMIIAILRFWKIGAIGIILLILFVPASIPVLKNILDFIFSFAKH